MAALIRRQTKDFLNFHPERCGQVFSVGLITSNCLHTHPN